MKLLALAILLTLTLGSALHAGDKDPAPTWRNLEVTVTDTSGKPVADVAVDLIGVARWSMYNHASLNEGEPRAPGWHFTTDAEGHCRVRLGRFSGYNAKKLTGEELPGWGTFHLVADAGKAGFVISPRIYHPEDAENGAEQEQQLEQAETRNELDTWLTHRVLLTEDSTPLDLQLRAPLRLSGMLVDPAGKPLAGSVAAWTDLAMESPTGYGGELLRRETKSDASGKFVLESVYPETFHISVLSASKEKGKVPHWIKTRVRKQWIDEAVDRIAPRDDEKEIDLRFVMSPDSSNVFRGRITGPDDKPLAGAKITAGISFHRDHLTYSDNHHFVETESAADGSYELRSSGPFLRFLAVRAQGFKEANEEFEDCEPPFGSPGEYDFKLEKKGK